MVLWYFYIPGAPDIGCIECILCIVLFLGHIGINIYCLYITVLCYHERHLRMVVLYDEQLPPVDQRVQEESTRMPNISSPGMNANSAMKTSFKEESIT